jgi:hypothetical protein
MEQLEVMGPHHLVHSHGQGEIVRREFKERITADVNFVKEYVWQKRGQTERLPIRDEMNFVPPSGERDAKLGRYGA